MLDSSQTFLSGLPRSETFWNRCAKQLEHSFVLPKSGGNCMCKTSVLVTLVYCKKSTHKSTKSPPNRSLHQRSTSPTALNPPKIPQVQHNSTLNFPKTHSQSTKSTKNPPKIPQESRKDCQKSSKRYTKDLSNLEPLFHTSKVWNPSTTSSVNSEGVGGRHWVAYTLSLASQK